MSLSQYSQGVIIDVAAAVADVPLLRVTAENTGQQPLVLPLVDVLNNSTVIQQPDTTDLTNSGSLSIDSVEGTKIQYTTNVGADLSFVQIDPAGDINITVPVTGAFPGGTINFTGDTADFTNVGQVLGLAAVDNNIRQFTINFTGLQLPTTNDPGAAVDVGGVNAVNGAFMISVSGSATGVGGQPAYLPTSTVFMCVKQSGQPAIFNSMATINGQFGEHWNMTWDGDNKIRINLTRLNGGNDLTGATYTARIAILHFTTIIIN